MNELENLWMKLSIQQAAIEQNDEPIADTSKDQVVDSGAILHIAGDLMTVAGDGPAWLLLLIFIGGPIAGIVVLLRRAARRWLAA